MEKICDMHTHSVFSDGTCTPTEIVNSALKLGLSAVALCDHNTVDGLSELLTAAEGKDIEAVAGAEFSVGWEGKELHLLGLYISPKYFGQIAALMRPVNALKEQSNIQLVQALNRAGYKIDYETVKSKTPNGAVNRAHIAKELTDKGYTPSEKVAFDTLLSPETGYYREPKRISLWEMLDVIKSIGAVPVLAHPFLKLTEEQLLQLLPLAKKAGLVGMECSYPLYTPAEAQRSLQIASALDLLPSGGSDFHGQIKPDIKLGFGRDNLSVPYEWAVALKQQAQRMVNK